MTLKEQLAGLVETALQAAQARGDLPAAAVPPVVLEAPKSRTHGDWATNIALVLAPALGLPPRDVAARLLPLLPVGGESPIARAEVAGPGFLNLFLRPDWRYDILRQIDADPDGYGRARTGAGQRILVEFVSTNPNGPITVAGGRNAAIGDTLAALLSMTGHTVSREYYINDALNSVQMNDFGRSVLHRYLQLQGHPKGAAESDEDPKWLYRGDYVWDIARGIQARHGDAYVQANPQDPQTVQVFRDLAQDGMIAQQRADLEAFGVRFDAWFSESSLHQDGRVQQAIDQLAARGYTFEKEGAVWLRSTDFGDDKDRVLVRTDGTPTYIAGDAAYHKDKFDRGYARALNVWGADHAGYVARTKAAVAALGYDPARLDILLYQLVRILKDGVFVVSSKRKGDVLELKADLIDEIGKDAARFFFLMRSANTDLDIDLDLAKRTERENPVYYVQYAHARIQQTLEKARQTLGLDAPAAAEADLSRLTQEAEEDLIKKLSEFPDEVLVAARDYAPQRITQYVRDLAALFHGFYDAGNRDPALRVVSDDVETSKARLVLVQATRVVLSRALGLLGVSAPDRM